MTDKERAVLVQIEGNVDGRNGRGMVMPKKKKE